jgi:membrane-associated phospholipid phosphatase
LLSQLLCAKPLSSYYDTLSVDCRNAGRTFTRIAFAPFHADVKEWLMAAGLAGSIAAATLVDTRTRDLASSIHHPWIQTVDDIGHAYQNKYITFGAAGTLYSYGFLAGEPKVKKIGIEIVAALAVAGTGTQFLKYVLGRARPTKGLSNGHFNGPTLDNGYHSFPSGDVTVAFAQSSVLSSEIRFWPATVALYGLAAATAFQRVHRDQHWFSDVVGGAVWGTAVGLGVVDVNRRLLSSRAHLEFGLGKVTICWL